MPCATATTATSATPMGLLGFLEIIVPLWSNDELKPSLKQSD